MRSSSIYGALLVAALALAAAPEARAADDTLKVYLLTGQSNMQGHAYVYNQAYLNWNIPTLGFLLEDSAASNNYLANMPDATYTFKESLDASWLNARDDVWAMQYRSGVGAGSLEQVEPMDDSGTWHSGAGPLAPGFGSSNSLTSFGPELGMGQRLGAAMQSPVFLFKSNEGGTTLGNDWRPPSAAADRGGSVGVNYTNTINQFKSFLDDLDTDLSDNGLLDNYGGAVGYEVAGFVWLQGWNEQFNDAPYTAAQLQAEYADNLVDLVQDVRAADARISDDLGAVIIESSDQNASLNTSRAAAVATLNSEIPGSAVFFETSGMINQNWGNNPDGAPFTTQWGFHFNARAENYLEIGWRAGDAILASGFTGSEVVPEPGTGLLLLIGLLAFCLGRRSGR